jgi:hypothetical protein
MTPPQLPGFHAADTRQAAAFVRTALVAISELTP